MILILHGQRRAQGTTGISRRGLNPELLKWPFPQQATIANTIQGDPPR